MAKKILLIIIDAALSFAVFIFSGVVLAIVDGSLFGSTKGADGNDYINHSGPVVLISIALAIVFAIFFYRFFNRKNKTVKE